MRIVILLSIFACVCGSHINDFLLLDDASKQQLSALVSACIKEVDAAPDLMERIDKGDFPDRDQEKCMLECYLTKSGFMFENGEYDVPKVKAVYDPKYHTMLDGCDALQAPTKCEKAYMGYKCVISGTNK